MAILSLDESLKGWRGEIKSFHEGMAAFGRGDDVKEIMYKIAAWRARAAQIRNIVVRSPDSRANSFRTQELDQFLNEASEQFKIYSRIASIMTTEWEISKD